MQISSMHFNIHHCMITTRKTSQVSDSEHTVRLVSHINLIIPLVRFSAPSPVSFCHSAHSALPYPQSLQSQQREKNQSGNSRCLGHGRLVQREKLCTVSQFEAKKKHMSQFQYSEMMCVTTIEQLKYCCGIKLDN